MWKNQLVSSIGAVALLSMIAYSTFWISLHPYSYAQGERNSSINSSTARTSENRTTENSSDPSVTFYRFVDNVCNLTSTNKEPGAADNKEFLTYINPYYGIIIEYPPSWTYKESNSSPQDDKVFSIVSFSPPLSSDPNAETNLHIWVEKLEDQAISLDEYARNVIKSYRENNSNFSLIRGTSTNSTISNGYPAYNIVFTDYSDNLQRKSIEIGTISNVSKSAYYITYNTDASLYGKFDPLVKRMIGSFGIYDYHSLSDEELFGKLYIQGYNDGLNRMISALCHSHASPIPTSDDRQ
jgi:hypothetical protein